MLNVTLEDALSYKATCTQLHLLLVLDDAQLGTSLAIKCANAVIITARTIKLREQQFHTHNRATGRYGMQHQVQTE